MEEKRDVATIRLRPRTHINVHNSVQSSRNHFPTSEKSRLVRACSFQFLLVVIKVVFSAFNAT